MGHITYSKESLVPLIDRLNKYPIGLVDNEKLRQILSIIFSEQEAFVASRFPLVEVTLKELAHRCGMSEDKLLPVLDNMADKGLVMDMPYKNTTYYLLMPGVIGFIEFTFMKHREDLPLADLAKLLDEYMTENPESGPMKEFFGSDTQLTRALVYEDQIPVTSQITSYESAREIIQNADFGAVSMCFCRHKREHEGKSCKKDVPKENICISLGNGARFLTRRGFAEEKSKAELLEIVEYAKSKRLTHVTDNIRNKPTFICNCCSCCCEIMIGVQHGFHDGVAKSSFIAKVDPSICDYCGDCFAECNVKAIGLDREIRNESGERVSQVDPEICLGCGACISACEKGGLALIPRKDYVDPPLTKKRLFMSILKEKGRLNPFIFSRIKTTMRRWVRKP